MVKKKVLVFIGIVIVMLLSILVVQFYSEVSAAHKLEVRIAQVRLTEIGLTSCDLVVTINLTNPTSQQLDICYASFDVFVAGSYVGNSSVSDVVLPRTSSTEKIIPLTLLYSDIAWAVVEGIRNRNFNLIVRGDVETCVFYGLWSVTVPFSISSTYS